MMNNFTKWCLYNSFSRKNKLKLFMFGIICMFIIGCSPDTELSGEYNNKRESVTFDSSDKSAIIKTKLMGMGTTVHGNYKIKDNKVYIFDKSGREFGVFVITKNNNLDAEKGSRLSSLMALENIAKLLGKWKVSNEDVYFEFLDNNTVVVYGNQKKIGAFEWEMLNDGELSITLRGKTVMSGKLNGDTLKTMTDDNHESTLTKVHIDILGVKPNDN